MKKQNLTLLLSCILSFASTAQVQPPTQIYFTPTEISGLADPSTVIKINKNVGAIVGVPIITVAVNSSGYFKYEFETALPVVAVGPPVVQPSVNVWAENVGGTRSTQTLYQALDPATAINRITTGALVLPRNNQPNLANNPEISGRQASNTTFRYKVRILNTNFTIPLARFNFTRDNPDSKTGEVLLFNSVGAGVGISWGEIERTTDNTGATINTEFTNTFGIHLGVLFSSGKDGAEQKNIFSPTISMSILDFQLGAGYELGTRTETQRKGFVTLAYAIPLSKLVRGKYYIFTASNGYNATHPLPNIPGGSTRNSVHRFIQ